MHLCSKLRDASILMEEGATVVHDSEASACGVLVPLFCSGSKTKYHGYRNRWIKRTFTYQKTEIRDKRHRGLGQVAVPIS